VNSPALNRNLPVRVYAQGNQLLTKPLHGGNATTANAAVFAVRNGGKLRAKKANPEGARLGQEIIALHARSVVVMVVHYTNSGTCAPAGREKPAGAFEPGRRTQPALESFSLIEEPTALKPENVLDKIARRRTTAPARTDQNRGPIRKAI
jgi:hypothetical protein